MINYDIRGQQFEADFMEAIRLIQMIPYKWLVQIQNNSVEQFLKSTNRVKKKKKPETFGHKNSY